MPRAIQSNSSKKQPSRTCYHILLSCCVFFAILCACLATALIFVGKHYVRNYQPNHQNYSDHQMDDMTTVNIVEQPTRFSTKLNVSQLNANNYQETTTAFQITNSSSDGEESGKSFNLEDISTRLPRSVQPTHYNIFLHPDLDAESYNGRVTITIDVLQSTDNITLHASHLNVTDVKLYSTANNSPVANDTDFILVPHHELLIIRVMDGLALGLYNLVISFNAGLAKRLIGFYSSKYRDGNQTRTIATSKFEPTYARQAFPCFDEPNMKAKFSVHIEVPNKPNFYALSNMPQESVDNTNNGKIFTFAESVKMSTYLACFIVCDFTYREESFSDKKGDIKTYIRVYATPAQREKTVYPLWFGKNVMEFYLEYFQIPYPLPKLDMIAIPDFVSGAMEHWGLVTFRETALLFDEQISTAGNQQRVATVIAHELAHSWFGNFVTMDWWNDLWLNEGFASYIEYKGVNAVHPDWQMESQFLNEDLHAALKLDAKLSSHPIVQVVKTPDQITEIFDAITYNKGASLLRMLEQTVSPKIFQNAVTVYLKKHAYGNAVTQDLLNEISALLPNSEVDIVEFMNTFTIQEGYPVVDVKRDGKKFILTQKRFLTGRNNNDERSVTNSTYNYKYTIPVTYITSDNRNTRILKWFPFNQDRIEITSDAKWLKFNHEQVGFYRVNYEEPEWKHLIDNYQNFSVSDRTHLIEESFHLAQAGQLNYNVPMNLTSQLKYEMDFVPWVAAHTVFNELNSYMRKSSQYLRLKEHMITVLLPAYHNYTSNQTETDFLRRRASVEVLSLACMAGYKEALQSAYYSLKAFLYEGHPLKPDQRAIVLKYGMSQANKGDWTRLWELYLNETDAGEKMRMLDGLAYINDTTLLTKLIDLAKDEINVRGQDYFTCLVYISRNPVGESLVWVYVREHWEELVDRFTLNDRKLGSFIATITSHFNTKEQLEEMEIFFAKYPEAGAGAIARKTALETVKNNIYWTNNYRETIENWLSQTH